MLIAMTVTPQLTNVFPALWALHFIPMEDVVQVPWTPTATTVIRLEVPVLPVLQIIIFILTVDAAVLL